ncbi:MAG: HD domain-containing protein [Treponema sp.]|nr:HD domain-containing protein [Treponema sp.]
MEIKETKIYRYLEKNSKTFHCENINKVTAYAQSFLSRIPTMFSNYTNHDIGHSARVADYMAELLPCSIEKYNDTELVVMLYSAIFHDIGMAVSETENNLTPSTQDDIRKTHHIRSEKFINGKTEKDDCFTIDNESSVNFKSLVASIVRTHGEDFSWIEKNLKKNECFGNDIVNPQFISCLLRLGDYLDFDSRRTPYHLFQFLNLSKKSFSEWKKHFPITNYNKV